MLVFCFKNNFFVFKVAGIKFHDFQAVAKLAEKKSNANIKSAEASGPTS